MVAIQFIFQVGSKYQFRGSAKLDSGSQIPYRVGVLYIGQVRVAEHNVNGYALTNNIVDISTVYLLKVQEYLIFYMIHVCTYIHVSM